MARRGIKVKARSMPSRHPTVPRKAVDDGSAKASGHVNTEASATPKPQVRSTPAVSESVSDRSHTSPLPVRQKKPRTKPVPDKGN